MRPDATMPGEPDSTRLVSPESSPASSPAHPQDIADRLLSAYDNDTCVAAYEDQVRAWQRVYREALDIFSETAEGAVKERAALAQLMRWRWLEAKMRGWAGTPEECAEFDALSEHVWSDARRVLAAPKSAKRAEIEGQRVIDGAGVSPAR